MKKVKADAVRFIPDSSKPDIWSDRYFNDLSEYMKLE
jgi:hypothetical protein